MSSTAIEILLLIVLPLTLTFFYAVLDSLCGILAILTRIEALLEHDWQSLNERWSEPKDE